MKALFLTSSLGCSVKVGDTRVPTNCDNSNLFIDNLRQQVGNMKKLTIIASNPDNALKLDSQAKCISGGLALDGFHLEDVSIIDHRFHGNIRENILSADMVFLCGGHVPTQNRYFDEIGLKEILRDYNGVVVGQSAGSMNCSNIVYAQPESEDEFQDPKYEKLISGLGLTDIVIMPHMNRAKIDELCGVTTYEMCLEDSYKIPHYGITDGGYILVKDGKCTAYGKTVYFENGKETLICDNGESRVLYKKENGNEKNN